MEGHHQEEEEGQQQEEALAEIGHLEKVHIVPGGQVGGPTQGRASAQIGEDGVLPGFPFEAQLRQRHLHRPEDSGGGRRIQAGFFGRGFGIDFGLALRWRGPFGQRLRFGGRVLRTSGWIFLDPCSGRGFREQGADLALLFMDLEDLPRGGPHLGKGPLGRLGVAQPRRRQEGIEHDHSHGEEESQCQGRVGGGGLSTTGPRKEADQKTAQGAQQEDGGGVEEGLEVDRDTSHGHGLWGQALQVRTPAQVEAEG